MRTIILLLQNMLSYYRIYANDLSYYVQCLTFSDAQEFFIIYSNRLQKDRRNKIHILNLKYGTHIKWINSRLLKIVLVQC